MYPGREPSEGCPPSTPSSMWVAEAEEACQDLVTTCARLGHRDSVCISSHLLAAAGIAGGGERAPLCAVQLPGQLPALFIPPASSLSPSGCLCGRDSAAGGSWGELCWQLDFPGGKKQAWEWTSVRTDSWNFYHTPASRE